MKIKRLKNIYNGMMTRCYNKSSINYKYYGGKNIKVCDEWKNDFNSFYEWSLKNGYSDELTLDRVDNLNGYQPNNCKWSTMEEQSYNRSISVELTLNEKTMFLTQWADFLNIDKRTLSWRYRNGWTDEEILTTPTDHKERKVTFNNETHSLSEWSKITGIRLQTIHKRLKLGWSIEDTLTKKTSDREVKITYDDKTMTMREWADFLQIPKTTLSSRRARGWSDKEMIEGKRSTFE